MSKKSYDTSHERPAVPPDVERTLASLDPEEARELALAWAIASLADENAPSDRAVEAAWNRFAGAMTDATAREGEGTAHRQRRSHDATRRSGRKPERRVRSVYRLGWLAACVAAAAIAALLLWPRTITVTAPSGELVAASLPDGSEVQLAPASTLSYRRGFRGEARRIELSGEAYFDVVSAERPFRVVTFNATISVLGTAFSVRARPDDATPATRVAVASGNVEVNRRGATAEGVRLKPGQMSEVRGSDAATAPRDVSMDAELAWRSGGFARFEQPLSVVLADVERRFGVRIETRPSDLDESLTSLISVYLPQAEDAETVLRDICSVVGCRYEETPAGFVVQVE